MPETTFRTYEADEANAFAVRLAQSAAEMDTSYSPVVLYGAPGAGKSHLLGAIVGDLRKRHPDLPFLYLTGRTPTDYLLASRYGGDLPDRGYMYRPYDDQKVLVVDDLGRFGTDAHLCARFEELFDAFYESDRLIVLACAQTPDSLPGFAKRFLSRVSSGVTAEVGMPGPETRIRILKLEAEQLEFPVEAKALLPLAEAPVETVGHLVDLFRQVRLYCVATGQNPTLETIKPLVAAVIKAQEQGKKVSAEQWCAAWYNHRVEALKAEHREELKESQDTAATLQAHVQQQEKGSTEVTAKISKAVDALRARDTELQKLRDENEEMHKQIDGELPRLQELVADKEARLAEVREEALQEEQKFQAQLAETAGSTGSIRAEAKAEVEKLAAAHTEEVEALEKRLEEIYEALNDAQQDFAIQNQNKDKLLERLSDDFQKAKEEAVEARRQVEEQQGAGAQIGDERLAELEAAEAEARKQVATLQQQQEEALGALRDETAIEMEELRRQLDAKEGALRSITEQFQEKMTEVDRENQAAAKARGELEAVQEDAAGHTERIADLEAKLAAQEALAQTAGAKAAELTEQSEVQQAERDADTETAQKQIEKLQAEVDAAETKDKDLRSLRAELAKVQSQLDTAEAGGGEGASEDLKELKAANAELSTKLDAAEQREEELEEVANAKEDEAEAARTQLEKLSKAMQMDSAARDRELANLRRAMTDSEGAVSDQRDQIARLEQEMVQAKEAAASAKEHQIQVTELQVQVEARERALQTLQESFTDQIAEATAKARDREVALSGTVRELQTQLNQLQVNSDERESATGTLQSEIADLEARLETARASGGAAPASERKAPPRPRKPGAPKAAPAADKDDGAADAGAGVPTPPPLATIAIEATEGLNAAQTFDSYQPTGASAFSLRSAKQVCDTPGELYNPLVVYGPENAGKTHILHAVGNAISSARQDLNVVYASVESLMATLAGLEADTDLDTVALDADVLLLDDFMIEDLSPEQQLRVAQVLTNFVHDGRQLALASAVPPVKMTGIERELIRFLEEGLLAKFETNEEAVVQKPKKKAAAAEAAPAADAPADEEPAAAVPIDTSFDDMFERDESLTREQYRGGKVFDEFIKAYEEPNATRRSRFPLIVGEDDTGKRHHFFHALANALAEVFPDASIAIFSGILLAEVIRADPEFDTDAFTERVCQSDIVLLNDGDALVGGPIQVGRFAQDMVQKLLAQQQLLTIGLSKPDKRDKIFGDAISAGTKKKI